MRTVPSAASRIATAIASMRAEDSRTRRTMLRYVTRTKRSIPPADRPPALSNMRDAFPHQHGCDGEGARYTAHTTSIDDEGEGGMIGMRIMMIGVGVLLCTQASIAGAAQPTLAGQVIEGCKKELETHCKGVTP